IKTRLQGYPTYFSKGETTSKDSRSTEGSNYPNLVNQACRAHNLHFTIRKFLRVLQGLGYTSCKFGPKRTVGLLTITRSDGYPHIRTRDNKGIASGHNAPLL
ncbi:unnamed protein product, partial [Prunus brigantina]